MSAYVLAGVAAGLLLSCVHVVASLRAQRRPRFEIVALLVLSAVGIGTGSKVLKICVTADTLEPFADEDRVYIFLGGLALIWVSISAIVANILPTDGSAVD